MRVKRGVVGACAVALAGALSGCVSDDAIKAQLGGPRSHTATFAFKAAGGRAFLGHYSVRFLSMGTVSHHGRSFSATGGRGEGSMSFALAHPDPALVKRFAEFARGTFRSNFVYQGNTATGRATATAIVLTTFTSKKAGQACFKVTVGYSHGGQTITNDFRILGGTGDAVRLKGSGSYRRKKAPGGLVAVHGSARVAFDAPQALPPQCRG